LVASGFVADLLVAEGATMVVVSRNFRFGDKRAGDLATLERSERSPFRCARSIVGDDGPYSAPASAMRSRAAAR
jgi:FAD synthase